MKVNRPLMLPNTVVALLVPPVGNEEEAVPESVAKETLLVESCVNVIHEPACKVRPTMLERYADAEVVRSDIKRANFKVLLYIHVSCNEAEP